MIRSLSLAAAGAAATVMVIAGCSATVAGSPQGLAAGPVLTSTPTTATTSAPAITRTIFPTSTSTIAAPADGVLATTCEAFNAMGEQEQQRVSHDIAVALGRTALADNANFDLVARAACLMHPTQLVKDTWAFD